MSLLSKIQSLLSAANSKTGESDATLTDAVQTLIDGYGGITPTGNRELTQQTGTDVTNYATASVRSGSLALNTPSVNSSGLVTASATLSASGWIGSAPSSKTLQLTTQAAKTVTPSTSQQTAVASGIYTTGAVTVAAMPSGTAGTPSASKGTVSNHSVTVTPSVTNTTGYITGGTKTGTGVTVTAAELVSGSLTKDANGTYDVTNLAQLVVAIPVYDGSVS